MPQLADAGTDSIVRAMSGDDVEWWDMYQSQTLPNPWGVNVKYQKVGKDPVQTGPDVMNIAMGQVGADYVWAAENPQGPEGGTGAAFDCSGFTKYVLEQAGLSDVPHNAAAQQSRFKRIGRQELQPGDLVFYNYGRLEAGVADHVGVYIGNGQMVAASSSTDKVRKQPVDWDHFIGGGSTGLYRKRQTRMEMVPTRGRPETPEPTLVPASLGADASLVYAAQVDMADLAFRMDRNAHEDAGNRRGPDFGGAHAEIQQQLWQGFMDAGRPDLAKMVGTKAFNTWLGAESGWRPHVVSQYYSGHGRNAGLFQFALLDRGWVWDDVNKANWSYGATPYEQAKLVEKYFNLTPQDIENYADQINAGTYKGWG